MSNNNGGSKNMNARSDKSLRPARAAHEIIPRQSSEELAKQYTAEQKLKVENHRLRKIIAQQNSQIIQLSQKLENIDLYNEQQKLIADLGLSSPSELEQVK